MPAAARVPRALPATDRAHPPDPGAVREQEPESVEGCFDGLRGIGVNPSGVLAEPEGVARPFKVAGGRDGRVGPRLPEASQRIHVQVRATDGFAPQRPLDQMGQWVLQEREPLAFLGLPKIGAVERVPPIGTQHGSGSAVGHLRDSENFKNCKCFFEQFEVGGGAGI
jgi:hypothetical protein